MSPDKIFLNNIPFATGGTSLGFLTIGWINYHSFIQDASYTIGCLVGLFTIIAFIYRFIKWCKNGFKKNK